eukprot:scaffold15670_cov112-Isochrysis_galbana.AAC.5
MPKCADTMLVLRCLAVLMDTRQPTATLERARQPKLGTGLERSSASSFTWRSLPLSTRWYMPFRVFLSAAKGGAGHSKTATRLTHEPTHTLTPGRTGGDDLG